MVRREILYIFFLILMISVVIDARRRTNKHRRNRHRQISKSTEFDLLIFTQQWPQTVCFTWKKSASGHMCNLPTNDEWSIHGIWPTKNHELGPFYCNNSMPFDIKALESIEDQLDIEWMDIHKGKKGHELWVHEWQKHGTCAAVLEPLNTEYKYFKKGIDLLEKYDMKNVLGNAGITPGGTYDIRDILKIVQSNLGKRAMVTCAVNPKTDESYLSEVRICFDKTLELIDCTNIVGFPTNCSYHKKIIYPGTVPSVLMV